MPHLLSRVGIGLLLIPTLLTAQGAAGSSSIQPSRDVLHPGDAVRVRVWREPELSGDFPVDERGNVVLPRLGSQNVTGVQLDSLKNRFVSAYAAYFKTPPDVSFLRRVSVVGAVNKPGVYMIDPTMDLPVVLAMAGGVSSAGRNDRVQIKRAGEGAAVGVSLKGLAVAPPLYSGDEVIVPERSWIARNIPLTVTLITTTLTIISFLGR